MPSATTATVPPSPSLVQPEMEDRKRSLVNDVEDLAPSRKRMKEENGSAMRMSDEAKEKEVEDYQKDAILRQMKEYKRQKKDAEDQLYELQRRAKYHDDHLRTTDAWFAQLLDEIRVIAAEAFPSTNGPPASDELYRSALLFEDSEAFHEHLKSRSASIKGAVSDLFGRMPVATPEVEDLRKRLSQLLAREKEHTIELRRALDEKDLMYERLEQAMGRYMTAERKLDRAKSTQVLKLEKQAIMGMGDVVSPTTSKTPVTKKEQSEVNGDGETRAASAEVELARREAVAAADTRKAQLAEIEAENDRLTNELSAARTKLASLSDDDYASTHLFKSLRSKFDDVVKKINDLEATNARLLQEAQKIQSERTSYRTQVDEEARLQINEAEAASARAETDVARIRDHRDQLSAELAIIKSNKDGHAVSLTQAKELAAASALRVAALESEVQRLQLQMGEAEATAEIPDNLSVEELRNRLRAKESQYALLSNELPSMEAAWKKTQALASKKLQEVTAWEEQVARLNAEKAKADQKYFAAMKAKDLREAELKTLKTQAARSSEIVTQLKDGEARARELLVNLEKQLAESKDAFAKLEHQHRTIEQKLKEANIVAEGLKKSVDDLKSIISTKDKERETLAKLKRDVEEDLEKTKVRLEESKKQCDALRKSRMAASATDSDDWRKVAICPVCNANIRNTVLKLCGHVFCSACVKDLISNRSRKCPSCGRGFGTNDQMGIVLT